jgi:hypothetical protein
LLICLVGVLLTPLVVAFDGVDLAALGFDDAKYAELVVSSSAGSFAVLFALGVVGFLGLVSTISSSSSSETTF